MVGIRHIILSLFLIIALPLSHAAASCNDLEISPNNITFSENQNGKSITFTLENESDEQFELDDVEVDESSPFFEITVDDFPSQIDEDDTGKIRLEYDTEDVSEDQEETFTISVSGEFDDEECSFNDVSFTIDVTIADGDDICALISVTASDATLPENTTDGHSITIHNPTSQDFELTGFNVFDDSSAFNVKLDPSFSDNDFDIIVPANSNVTYPTEINSNTVDEDETDTAFIEVRGEFEDGTECSFNEISAEFDVTVEDAGEGNAVCSELTTSVPFVEINSDDPTIYSITLTNKGDQDFIVDSYFIDDKNYQTEFETLFTPDSIGHEDSENLTFSAIGYANTQSFNGDAFLNIKGHFTNGNTCTILNKKIPFHFTGTQGATCDEFYTSLANVNVLKGTTQENVLFNNPLNQAATITLSMTNGNVTPSKIIIPADSAKTYTLYFSNITQNGTLIVNTSIPGCTIPDEQTTILFSGLENAPVVLKNPPFSIVVGSSNEFALQVENKSAFTQEAIITIITKPGNGSFSKTISITGLDEPLIFFPMSIIAGKNEAIVQIKSAGYITSHTIHITNPVIAPQPPQQNDDGIINTITGFFLVGNGFWIGVLIVLLLLALWLNAQRTEVVKIEPFMVPTNNQKTTVMETKTTTTTISKPATPNPDLELPEEAWMNPQKTLGEDYPK